MKMFAAMDDSVDQNISRAVSIIKSKESCCEDPRTRETLETKKNVFNSWINIF